MSLISKYLFSLLLLFSIYSICYSQSDTLDIYDLDFDQLSKLKITSASKTPQYIREVPSTVFVITSTEIEEKGYFTLDEALSGLPGFQFRNIIGFNSYVFQRGLSSQNNLILVLIDGIQVNELNSGGFYGGGQYNLSDVERIEVIYGPASVAWGTNAVSGIINIVTKSTTENHFEMNSLLGSFNTISTDAVYSYANKKNFGIKLSAMYKQSDKANLKGTAGDNNWTDLMENFENDYSLNLKVRANHFLIGTNYLQKQSSAATYIKAVGTNYKDYGTFWNIRFINNYLKYSKNISGHFTLNSTLYNRNATVLDNSVLYVTDTSQIGYYRPNNLTGFENTIDYNSNKNLSITGGATIEYEQLAKKYSITYSDSTEQKPPKPEKPVMENNYLLSLFLEPRLVVLNSFYLSGGIRFDQSSIYEQVLTPRAGLSYCFQNQVVRFSYAEAFRAPKPWDYTDGLGNNSLLPEKMNSFEMAFVFSISDNYTLDLTGYKNKLENAIFKEVTEEWYRWINKGEINTDGLEFFFRYSSYWIKSSVNYTFNHSYNEDKEQIPEISKHTGNISVTGSLNKYLKLNLRAEYIGKRKNPKTIVSTQSDYIDPCLIFHSALSLLGYKGFTVQLIIKNLFDKEYYHTSNREPDRYRQPQRTVMVSVGYSLNKKGTK